MTDAGRKAGGWPSRLVDGLAAVLLLGALALPSHVGALVPSTLARVPLEAAVAAVLLAALPYRPVHRLIGLLVGVAVVVKLADMGAWQALGRPFNPVLDWYLLDAAMNLLTGAVGRPTALALAALAALLALAIPALAIWAAARIGRRTARHRPATALAGVAVAVLWGGLWLAGIDVRRGAPAASYDTSRLMALHVEKAAGAIGDRAAFQSAAAVDPWGTRPADQLFRAIAGRDVLVVFVESYGVTVLDDDRYRGPVTAVLADGERRLGAKGIAMRSARLTSPTVGGQSWLAHGTLMSGLWVDNQRRYDTLMASDRPSLNGLFRRAGWRTVAVMPAITMAWPEATWFDYDRVLAAADLGYRGRPFNWVTMPDQYTLAALRREELDRPARAPVMAEVALISSHAPWTPIPTLVDWAAVGDGRIFDAMAAGGETPKAVWADPDKVRLQFRLSIEYAIGTLVSYVETFGLDDTVLIVVGDHQPAPLVTGDDAPRDVPIHVLSTDPALMERFAALGFVEGLTPGPQAPVIRMDAARDLLIEALSGEPPAAATVSPAAAVAPATPTSLQ